MFYYVQKAHSLMLLSLSSALGLSLTDTHIVCTHTLTKALMYSTTLTILSVTSLRLKTTWLLTNEVTTAPFMKKMNLKSHYRHCCRSLTHRGNINLSLSRSHNFIINCISLLSTAQASVTVKNYVLELASEALDEIRKK